MGFIWSILQALAPYAKIAEYIVIIATLVTSIYASRRIKAAAREIQEAMRASTENLRQEVLDISETLQKEFASSTGKLQRDVSEIMGSMVEGQAGKPQTAPVTDSPSDDNAGEAEATAAPTQQSAAIAGKHEAHRLWWQPIVDIKFDDKEQAQPRLFWSNNARTPMPWPRTWLTAWRNVSPDGACGVALSGDAQSIEALWRVLRGRVKEIESKLPTESSVSRGRFGIRITKPNAEFQNDDEKRAWIKKNLNTFVNVLKPYLIEAVNKQASSTKTQ